MPRKKPSKRESLVADVVEARCFVLVDDKNRTRAEMSVIGDATHVQLMDVSGRPRLTLQIDADGSPSICLFDHANTPGVSLSINKHSRGVCITGATWQLSLGGAESGTNHPPGVSPNIFITDPEQNRSWMAIP